MLLAKEEVVMYSKLRNAVQQYVKPEEGVPAEKCTPNGAIRAKCVPRPWSGFRGRPRNIAAIDFGTKNCSLAYITENDRIELTQGVPKLPMNGMYLRVPTAILLGHRGEIEAFGHDAQASYRDLEEHERENYFYFEEIKMNLQRDQAVSREMKVKALNGKEFFLVDIIAQILKYVKDDFIVRHLQRGGHPFTATHFDWVITVPAIWRASGKQMMREAGYKAGLCSEECSGRLTLVSGSPPLLHVPAEKSPDKLSLALEPESAALYCHEMLKQKLLAPYCRAPGHLQSDCSTTTDVPHTHLIVDIGGGTVDISAHKVVNSLDPSIEELHPPVGNSCGGTMVNREFSKFLELLVNDPGFSTYTDTCDPEVNLRNKFELNQLINVDFEEQKQIFGRLERRREAVIHLPTTMLELYRENIEERIQTMRRSDVRLVRQNLRISPSKMEEFFEPAVKGILHCISDLLQKVSMPIDVIYLVGGFGGSPYIYQKVSEKFGHQSKCIVPLNPEFAVVEGAALFRSNPAIVHARKADATYGKTVIRPFEEGIHDPSRKTVDDDGIAQCHDLFQTIVEVDETVSPKYVYTCTSIPASHNQRNMFVELYSSLEEADNIWYVAGERSGGAMKIGELTVDMPDPTGDKLREVEFTFDFSHTEIQVKGYDKTSGTEVKTVVDFLSAQIS